MFFFTTVPGKSKDVSIRLDNDASKVKVFWSEPTDPSCHTQRYSISYCVLIKDMCDIGPFTNNTLNKFQENSPSLRKSISGLYPNSLYRFCVWGYNLAGSGEITCQNDTTLHSGT